eukprot:COSAG02_NODE_17415_length_1005_cov_4.268212_1_plen_159_part_10
MNPVLVWLLIEFFFLFVGTGMPVAAADTDACRSKCEADSACALYSFLEEGCTYGGADPEKPQCTLSGGCCYLKSEEVAGVAPKINSCACTGYVRAPPESGFRPTGKPPAGATNVLYVLVDDLRPELEPFGQTYAHTPNMQKLADSGTVFQNAYCQISVC